MGARFVFGHLRHAIKHHRKRSLRRRLGRWRAEQDLNSWLGIDINTQPRLRAAVNRAVDRNAAKLRSL